MLWKNMTLSWFEIPVTDMTRATAFYERVFGVSLRIDEHGPLQMAVFPIEGQGMHGALVRGPSYTPSATGALVYFDAGGDLEGALARVSEGGGTVLTEKRSIGQHGFIGVFEDTEGNRVALHSMR